MKKILPIILLLCGLAPGALAQSKTTKPTAPRATVQSFFSLLKAGKYDALFDFLPAQLQAQTTREQLAQSMKRLDAFLVIEKLEIGRVQERQDFAVVDTTIYGKLKQPIKRDDGEVREGRISVQQFLVREAGVWKLATADNRTQNFFLKRNPEFNQQFDITRPRFEVNQNGRWQPMQPMARPRQ